MTENQASNLRPVSMDVHHEIEQFLYKEARALDNEMLREWLDDMVHPAISYRLVIRDERYRKDKSPAEVREVAPFDDDIGALTLRVMQFESGLQFMSDPAPRMFRMIMNIECYENGADNEYTVYSCGTVSRFRRTYESERSVFRREDKLSRDQEGNFRLLARRVELGERVVRNKNLLFFL